MRRAVAALFVLLAPAALVPGAGAATPESLVRVSEATPHPDACGNPYGREPQLGSEAEPHLAVDPRDPTRLLASWQQDRYPNGGALSQGMALSRDGGRTWQLLDVPDISTCPSSDHSGTTDPWSSIGGDGTAYAAALLVRDPGPFDLNVSTSDDGGARWGDPVRIVDRSDYQTGFPDKEALVADPRRPGHAYAAWTRIEPRVPGPLDSAGVFSPVRFRLTTDGGRTWSPEQTVYGRSPGRGSPTVGGLVVLQDGALLVLTSERGDNDFVAESEGRELPRESVVRVVRSDDQGQTWSPPTTVATVGLGEGNDPEGGEVRSGVFPSIAVGLDGRVHVAWADLLSPTRAVIGVASSSDGGRTWSDLRTLPGNPDDHPFTPTIAASGDGRIGVTYYDYRHDVAGDGRADAVMLLAHSGDGGETWSDVQLTRPFDVREAPKAGDGRFLGDYTGLVGLPSGFGAFFAATTPLASGEFSDTFFVRVRFGARPKLRLTVRPRRVPVGRRTRVRARVTARIDGRRVPIAGARVCCGRRRATTDRAGSAVVVIHPRRAGRRRLRAKARDLRRDAATVRVIGAR